MSDQARKKTPKRLPWPSLGVRSALGVVAIAVSTVLLAGSWEAHAPAWHEGQVAPYAVYSPFRFTSFENGSPVTIERGELLASRGERVTAEQVGRLNAVRNAQKGGKTRLQWLGAFLLSCLFTAVGAIYLKRYEPKAWRSPGQLTLVLLVVGIALGASRAALELALPALAPTAAAAMLVAMLLGPRLGLLVGLLTAGLAALMGGLELPFVIGLTAGCFGGVYSVQGIRRRIHFFRAGLITGAIQALAIFASAFLLQWGMEAVWTVSAAGFAGAVLSAVITFCLLPICESLFGLITDVTLLELSDLNHPLLKELSVKAPGTYHHSLIVANLAEAACEAVGANPLLGRVGCYFHDIGKMLHPEYFVENQPPEESRHDRLAPSMSSLVILNHVKEGIELAQKHRLNRAVIDFIPGHHGTGLIYYFYRRAMEEVEDQAELQEERFRYPGPKPQTRETAIALLADSSEAATRALPQKTPARIQEVVQRIINNKFIDGQLDECELTLRDLHRISEAFQRVLAGIYHSRIEYPKQPGEEIEERPSTHAG